MTHFAEIEHLADYDVAELDHEPLVLSLAQRVAQQHAPIVVTNEGVPLAALVALDDLAELYGELRCLRVLYTIATEHNAPRR